MDYAGSGHTPRLLLCTLLFAALANLSPSQPLYSATEVNAIRYAIDTAKSYWNTPNVPVPITSERKLTRSGKEWQEIQHAFTVLEKLGISTPRVCFKILLESNDISLVPGLKVGKQNVEGSYTPNDALGYGQELRLSPEGFMTQSTIRENLTMSATEVTRTQVFQFEKFIALVDTIRHECSHWKFDLFSKTDGPIPDNLEEAFVHHGGFLFFGKLFTQGLGSSIECEFLRVLVAKMESEYDTIVKHYLPYALVIPMRVQLAKATEQYRRICDGSHGSSIVNGYWSDPLNRFVGTVTRYQSVRIRAWILCEGKERVNVFYLNSEDWAMEPRLVKSGSKVEVSPPSSLREAQLEGAVINGKSIPLVNGKLSVRITEQTVVVFKYRCKKDLARSLATDRAALQEQARQSARDVAVLDAQRQTLSDLDAKCERDCEQVRHQIAGLQAQRVAAAAALGALQAQEAQAKGKVTKTEGEITDLNNALAAWNAKTTEQQDAARRQAAQAYNQNKVRNSQRNTAARDFSTAMEETFTATAAARIQGATATLRLLPAIRQRQREISARFATRLKDISQRDKDALRRLNETDVNLRHPRLLPILVARLAQEREVLKVGVAESATKALEVAELEQQLALLRQKLLLCEERWERVRNHLAAVVQDLERLQMYQGQVAEALAGAGEGSPTPQEINRLKAHRKQLAEQQAAMRTHRAEQERTHQDLEIRAARLAGRRTALNGAATQAGRASQQAQAKGAAKGGAAAMAGLALQGLFGSVANAQAWLPVPQAGLVAALGQDLPAPDWQDGWEGFADEIEWQLAWDCYWLLVSGWMTEVEAAQAWAEGAAWEELAETDPKTVRDRQTTLEAEAADFYLEADQHHNDYEEAMGEAWFTLDEQEWAEQSALLADSFVFDANFALNMIDAELSALDASLESAGPGVEVDLRATGEESGHIFDAVITNLGEEAITYIFERGLVLLSGSRNHSDIAVTEPVTVEVEPGESATVPVQGFPMDPDMETPDQWDEDGLDDRYDYTPGEVSFEVVDVLDTTDEVLAEQGLQADSDNRTAVAQWAFWRRGGLPASRMTLNAFLDTVGFLDLMVEDIIGGFLGDLLGGRGKNDEAKGLMAAVDEVVARSEDD